MYLHKIRNSLSQTIIFGAQKLKGRESVLESGARKLESRKFGGKINGARKLMGIS